MPPKVFYSTVRIAYICIISIFVHCFLPYAIDIIFIRTLLFVYFCEISKMRHNKQHGCHPLFHRRNV